MDPILLAQLAAAGFVGAIGGFTISEVRNSYRVQAIVARHELQAEEWRKREDEEVKAKNLYFVLAKTFPSGVGTREFRDTLESIKQAAEAIGHIHTFANAIEPNNLHVLASYLKDIEAKQTPADKSLVHSLGDRVK